jgi:hypothetical protein
MTGNPPSRRNTLATPLSCPHMDVTVSRAWPRVPAGRDGKSTGRGRKRKRREEKRREEKRREERREVKGWNVCESKGRKVREE